MKTASRTISGAFAVTAAMVLTGALSLSPAAYSADYSGVSPNTLSRAVEAIEQSTGGRVLEIRLLHKNGPGYVAVIAKGQELTNLRVQSPSQDVVVLAAQETPQWMLDWQLRADMKDIHKAKVSSADAIRTAERATDAPAVDAGLAKPLSADNSVLAYNIEVVKGGVPKRVAIDARTGQMISDPETVLSDWTPERLASEEEHPTKR